FFFQAEDGIRDRNVTGVQTCALPISDQLECASVWFCHIHSRPISPLFYYFQCLQRRRQVQLPARTVLLGYESQSCVLQRSFSSRRASARLTPILASRALTSSIMSCADSSPTAFKKYS